MTISQVLFVVWLAITVLPLSVAMAVAASQLARQRSCSRVNDSLPCAPVEVFVPVKGAFPYQEQVLNSILDQHYPGLQVTFIVEALDDPANSVVDRLCRQHGHGHKLVSGLSVSCAQKNHNLVQATKELRNETRILLFYDSTNAADPGWIERMTRPLRNGTAQVVTTFRAFDPHPRTLGGLCQAIYASFLLLLQINRPTPWGGATAILRTTFEDAKVVEAWSNTVVDDLVLGNALRDAGVKVQVDSGAILNSPLHGQTVEGFLSYLDRQVLFPKFTNHAMWLQTVFFHLNVTAALGVALLMGILFPLGLVGTAYGWVSYGFICWAVIYVGLLRRINPFSIGLGHWLGALLPCVGLTAFVLIRSIFRDYIDWHGRRYWPGPGGVVLKVDFLGEKPPTASGHAGASDQTAAR